MVEQAGGRIEMPSPCPPVTKPVYDEFMSSCLQYPRVVQKCLVFDFAHRNRLLCRDERSKYDLVNQRKLSSSIVKPQEL